MKKYFDVEKNVLRAQPRKSYVSCKKNSPNEDFYFEADEERRHNNHRGEMAKNVVRQQLRQLMTGSH
jgi:hypothetical protein